LPDRGIAPGNVISSDKNKHDDENFSALFHC
jgi:hypothetical protein